MEELKPWWASTLARDNPAVSVSCGTLIVGRQMTLGDTEHGADIGILDYSRKETDQFGVTSVVERAWGLYEHVSVAIGGRADYVFTGPDGPLTQVWTLGFHNVENGGGYLPTEEFTGHVGLYVGEDYGAYHVLGGNQSDGVTITRIARDRCIAVRRPVYKAVPATATPVRLAANGALSTNEA